MPIAERGRMNDNHVKYRKWLSIDRYGYWPILSLSIEIVFEIVHRNRTQSVEFCLNQCNAKV